MHDCACNSIDGFDFSVENPTTIGSQTGRAGAGKAKLGELTVNKAVDSTTPQLLQHVAQGTHFAGVEIDAVKTGAPGPAAHSHPTRYYFSTGCRASGRR
jgi:type VI protein secretion system component Hcp